MNLLLKNLKNGLMNSIGEFNGLKILTGINTHPGSGPIESHKHEIELFKLILDNVDNKNNPVMIEVGCYWAVWSLLFKQRYPSGKNILIELGKRGLLVGEKNFEMNGFDYISYHGGMFLESSGTFKNGSADLEYDKSENIDLVKFIPSINDDGVIGQELDFLKIYKDEKLDIVDVLHMDIQGSELNLVESISNLISDKKIISFVIATHSESIHIELIRKLYYSGYDIKINEAYGSIGGDGFIYAILK